MRMSRCIRNRTIEIIVHDSRLSFATRLQARRGIVFSPIRLIFSPYGFGPALAFMQARKETNKMFDAFLKIDGIPGESTDDKHKDWIEILSFDFGMDQPSSATDSSAGGGTTERVDIEDFAVMKHLDKASPKLYEFCCNGKHVKDVTLELCRAGGDKMKYLEVKMEQV